MDPVPRTAEGGGFDPGQAAALLDQATRQARRQFTPLTPALFAFRAVVALVVFGGVWLSVRGQHPYTGHLSGWAIAAATAAVAGFGGPAGSWLIMGIGLCAAYLGIAAFTAWRQRRSMVAP